jgi:5-formyltetrahydrofolate cyclo-ligase
MDSNLIRLSAPFTLKQTVLNKSLNSYSLHSLPLPASRNSQRLISFKLGSIRNDAAFDEAAFEAERLSLDAKAREAMAEASKRETSSTSTSENEDDPKAWKWVIRKRIWDLMEARNVAQNPRPVHHRIPNFVGASTAAQKVFPFSFLFFSYFPYFLIYNL